MEDKNKRSPYLWGIDLGLSSIGVTIYDLEKKSVMYVGSFQTDKIKKQRNRMHNALKLFELASWILEVKESFPPLFVGMEGAYVDTKRKNSTEVLLRVHGVINYIFAHTPQEYYAPKKVKAAIVHGNATKEDIQNVIFMNFSDVVFTNEDESDSFAVMLTVLIEQGLIEWVKPNFAEVIQLRKENR